MMRSGKRTTINPRERLVTDAEVFQEILHRYVAIARRDTIQPAFGALLSVLDDVLSIGEPDVLLAKEITLEDLRQRGSLFYRSQ